MLSVWVATWTHKYGANISVHATEAGAVGYLAEQARTNWDDLEYGRRAPDDDEQAVRIYLESHPIDSLECEEYDVHA